MAAPVVTLEDANELSCGVKTALEVIGGKWKMLILAQLVAGTRRYGELKRALPDVTEKMLIQQLKELEADGMIERIAYPVVPPKVEYSFTPYGRTICGVMKALYDWGIQHYEQKAEKSNEPRL